MERLQITRRQFLLGLGGLAGAGALVASGFAKPEQVFAEDNVSDIKVIMYHEVTPAKLTSD